MDVRRKVVLAWSKLSRRERRMFRGWVKHAPEGLFRCRCKVIFSLVQGRSPTEISRGGLCSSSQVYRVAHRFVEEGLVGLGDRREDNGQTKVTEEYEWSLLIAVAKSPHDYGRRRPTWTLELLCIVLQKETGIGVSPSRLSRVLRKHRVRLGSPKPFVRCPWKKARRMRRIRGIERLIQTLPKNQVVVYVDEVDIHLNPRIGRDWMLPGMQKQVATPGKNQKRYLAGALDAKSGQITWVEHDAKTSDLFIRLLWKMIKVYKNADCIHVILDNYRIHKSRRTEIALASAGEKIQLHFLPPYCPDHNRIERLWKDLHDNVTRNHTCPGMPSLMREVHIYLQKRNRQNLRAYAKAVAA